MLKLLASNFNWNILGDKLGGESFHRIASTIDKLVIHLLFTRLCGIYTR